MVDLPLLVMKIVVLFTVLLFCTSTAELTCNTLCKGPSFVTDRMSSYSEDEAIRVVLCNSICDHNVSQSLLYVVISAHFVMNV